MAVVAVVVVVVVVVGDGVGGYGGEWWCWFTWDVGMQTDLTVTGLLRTVLEVGQWAV